MLLNKIIKSVKNLKIKGEIENVEIYNLAQKIEKVKDGSLFFCFKGVNFDGHKCAKKAEKMGAKALIVERFVEEVSIPQILVKNSRKIMVKICNNFFNNILQKIKFIGITGTNGKTTTSHMIYNILNENGYKVGLIGTNGVKYFNKSKKTNLTTPDTIDLFYLLNEMQISGVKYVCMEVSAHALSLNKLYGIKFDVACFTNLTQDHLDFYSSMHKYFLAKLSLFSKKYSKVCFVNVDDKYGQILAKLKRVKTITYGVDNIADCFALNIKLNKNNSSFVCNIFDNVLKVCSPFVCKFNIYNLLLALCVCKYLGLTNFQLLQAINKLNQVDGRMNFYTLKNNAVAIIDFAHTPDGLKKVLENLNQIKGKGKIITVFGCGGNRDKTKRKVMGEIASCLSDKVYLTTDNPRNEKPEEIIKDILEGVKNKNAEVVVNRENAIIKAIKQSKGEDIVLIAGKGSEDYQEINNKKIKYCDKSVLNNYLLN